MAYTFADSHAMPHIDVDNILNHFGGEGMVVRELLLAGYDAPDKAAVGQWRRRKRIPSRWLIMLIYLSHSLGKPLDITKILGPLRRKPPRRSKLTEAAK